MKESEHGNFFLANSWLYNCLKMIAIKFRMRKTYVTINVTWNCSLSFKKSFIQPNENLVQSRKIKVFFYYKKAKADRF